jgi:hypothetical protein
MFKRRNHELQQFLNGMLCFHPDNGDILYNSHNMKSICCNVDVP